MFNNIDLEKYKGIINVPETETERQYYYMSKCKEIISKKQIKREESLLHV